MRSVPVEESLGMPLTEPTPICFLVPTSLWGKSSVQATFD